MSMHAQTSVIGYLLFAAVIVWVFVTVKRGQRRLAQQGTRRRSWDSAEEESTDKPYSQRLPDSIAARQTEAHKTARELLAQLDSRIGALEQWIREADRVAARLESALADARRATAGSTAAGHAPHEPDTMKSSSTAVPDPSSQTAPGETPPRSQADGLRSAGIAGPKPQPEMHEDTMTVARPSADRRYEEIYTLADYGLDAGEIAQRVGSPVGEVQLILSLRGQRQA